jgi:hypothetical protein
VVEINYLKNKDFRKNFKVVMRFVGLLINITIKVSDSNVIIKILAL